MSARRPVGIAALVATAWLLIGNVTHPIGTTEQYSDGVAFVEHAASTYWVVNHVLIAMALLVAPWLAWVWAQHLQSARARVVAPFAVILTCIGVAFGVLHVGGIDGVSLAAWNRLLARGGEAAPIGADVLLHVHLATMIAWSITLWGGAQTALGVTELLEGRRRWLGVLLLVCGALGFAFVFTIALQGQLTALSEGLLFRPSTAGFTLWLVATAWGFARTSAASGSLEITSRD
jgi:hypothetical protein